MENLQEPHEKLTEEEIKEEIEKLLKSNFKFKVKCDSSNWEVYEFDKLIKEQMNMIIKIRKHFSPEKTTLMTFTIEEMTDMFRLKKEEKTNE